MAATTERLDTIEIALVNHQMPDDGRTDRSIQAAIVNIERDTTNRLNDQMLNQLIDDKITSYGTHDSSNQRCSESTEAVNTNEQYQS